MAWQALALVELTIKLDVDAYFPTSGWSFSGPGHEFNAQKATNESTQYTLTRRARAFFSNRDGIADAESIVDHVINSLCDLALACTFIL